MEYPRDLRYAAITAFKAQLAAKLDATHEAATSDANSTTFLKHFGEFGVARLDQVEISGQDYVIEELQAMRRELRAITLRTSEPQQRELTTRRWTMRWMCTMPRNKTRVFLR